MSQTEASHAISSMMHYVERCTEMQVNLTKIAQHDSFKKLNLRMAREVPSKMLPLLKELMEVCLASSKNIADEESRKRRIKHEELQVAKRAKFIKGSEHLQNPKTNHTSLGKNAKLFHDSILLQRPASHTSVEDIMLSDKGINRDSSAQPASETSSGLQRLSPPIQQTNTIGTFVELSVSRASSEFVIDDLERTEIAARDSRDESSPRSDRIPVVVQQAKAVCSSDDTVTPIAELSAAENRCEDSLGIDDSNSKTATAPSTPRPGPTPSPTPSSTPLRPSKYDIEIGIVQGDSAITETIKDYCFAKFSTNTDQDRDGRFEKVLKTCGRFDLGLVKKRLIDNIESQSAKPVPNINMPLAWEKSDADKILAAIQDIKGSTSQAFIYKAYTQMNFYHAVEAKSKTLSHEISKTLKMPKTLAIEYMAKDRAGDQRQEKEQDYKKNFDCAYFAGRNWLDVVRWFGGPGIVIVFVLRGVSSSKVEKGWVIFQRKCLKHLAQYLCKIQELVTALGQDVLDVYCRDGRLSPDHVQKIRGVEGFFADDTEIEQSGSDAD